MSNLDPEFEYAAPDPEGRQGCGRGPGGPGVASGTLIVPCQGKDIFFTPSGGYERPALFPDKAIGCEPSLWSPDRLLRLPVTDRQPEERVNLPGHVSSCWLFSR
ncbi:hypothetical protein BOQ63_034505 [Streptomyces viridifaciens]|nr:hypothetical protein CP971_27570 [Streptomyces viridifaciens]UKZ09044.1 hypothetical protein BOQ63_034505 [Streptomyces viridifaciens]